MHRKLFLAGEFSFLDNGKQIMPQQQQPNKKTNFSNICNIMCKSPSSFPPTFSLAHSLHMLFTFVVDDDDDHVCVVVVIVIVDVKN